MLALGCQIIQRVMQRKATDDFLTIIDDGEVTSETLVAEVQGQLDRALPKMQKMSDDREAKAIAQSDALSRWSEFVRG